jgi:uncharacterized membrane protein YwzB
MTEEIIRVLAYFFGFAVSLYALTALDFNRFLRKNRPVPAQILMICWRWRWVPCSPSFYSRYASHSTNSLGFHVLKSCFVL